MVYSLFVMERDHSVVTRLFGLKTLIQCVLICLLYAAALEGFLESQHCLAGSSVTLGCTFKPPSSVEVNTLDVWWEVNRAGTKTILFAFENTTVTTHLSGYNVNVQGLLKGNASLHLMKTAVSDEGIYSCRIIIRPDGYERTVRLDVSARPVVSLPEQATVTRGEEKTILCNVIGFYPEQLKISWQSHNGPQPELCDICTGTPVPNKDGTYNVSSRITVHGNSIPSGGALYTCQIKHRSFPTLYSKNLSLTVQDVAEPFDVRKVIAATFVSSICVVVFILGGALMLYKHFHRDPPVVSEISTSEIIYANTPTELKCTVGKVKPRHLKVHWYKIPPGSCVDVETISDGVGGETLLGGIESCVDQAHLHTEGTHHISTLSVSLSTEEDRTMYCCVIFCRRKKFLRKIILNVKARPSLLHISSLPQIPEVGKVLVLCCRVEKFYPEDIKVEWYKQNGEMVQKFTQFGPFSDHERLYSLWSTTELTVTTVDDGTVCTCRLYHSSFPAPQYKDVTYHINTQGVSPSVMFIKCDPLQPEEGKECTINLCVKDFCPDRVTVTWFRDGETVSAGVFNSPTSLNINGLYSMWTFLKLTPRKHDLNAVFRCVVEHCAQTEPEEREFTLSDLKIG